MLRCAIWRRTYLEDMCTPIWSRNNTHFHLLFWVMTQHCVGLYFRWYGYFSCLHLYGEITSNNPMFFNYKDLLRSIIYFRLWSVNNFTFSFRPASICDEKPMFLRSVIWPRWSRKSPHWTFLVRSYRRTDSHPLNSQVYESWWTVTSLLHSHNSADPIKYLDYTLSSP